MASDKEFCEGTEEILGRVLESAMREFCEGTEDILGLMFGSGEGGSEIALMAGDAGGLRRVDWLLDLL